MASPISLSEQLWLRRDNTDVIVEDAIGANRGTRDGPPDEASGNLAPERETSTWLNSHPFGKES